MHHTALHIRQAEEADSRMLWEWANDPLVRASAYSTDPIPWEGHQQWFAARLESPDCHIYIVFHEEDAVGQVRFDRLEDGSATIDIHLAPGQRGKGFGTPMLQKAIEQYFADTDVQLLRSEAKEENAASANLFEKVGFTNTGLATVQGVSVYQFTLERS